MLSFWMTIFDLEFWQIDLSPFVGVTGSTLRCTPLWGSSRNCWGVVPPTKLSWPSTSSLSSSIWPLEQHSDLGDDFMLKQVDLDCYIPSNWSTLTTVYLCSQTQPFLRPPTIIFIMSPLYMFVSFILSLCC